MPIPNETDRPNRTLLRDRVQEQIREAILDGTLQPGERLRDDDLISWLGASRTPVREALTTLAQEGLIEMVPNRYTRIALPTSEQAAHAVRALGVLMGGGSSGSLCPSSPLRSDGLPRRGSRPQSSSCGPAGPARSSTPWTTAIRPGSTSARTCARRRRPPRRTGTLVRVSGRRQRVRTRDELTDAVWADGPAPTSNALDVAIGGLRRKVVAAGGTPAITAVRGLGYRLEP